MLRLTLLLLRLTLIAKAGGGPLPTHQAPVGGDVCPLRVCSEAEDKRRGTDTLSALAVPHVARLLRSCATWRLWPARHLWPDGSGQQLGTPKGERRPATAAGSLASRPPQPYSSMPSCLGYIPRHNCTVRLLGPLT